MEKLTSLGKKPFQFTIISAAQFVVVTVIAMLFYAGGTHSDPSAASYSFFRNFFSSLGLTVSPNGESNTISAILFFLALSLAGAGLVVYFIFVLQFFWSSALMKTLSVIGSIFGVFSGLCFIGVAFTPADVFLEAHGWFVVNTFRSFLIAVVPFIIVILLNRNYPNIYAIVYIIYALCLLGYILLMMYGPGYGTPNGEVVQATGQKLIVYAAIIAMLIQSIGSIRMVEHITDINPD